MLYLLIMILTDILEKSIINIKIHYKAVMNILLKLLQ